MKGGGLLYILHSSGRVGTQVPDGRRRGEEEPAAAAGWACVRQAHFSIGVRQKTGSTVRLGRDKEWQGPRGKNLPGQGRTRHVDVEPGLGERPIKNERPQRPAGFLAFLSPETGATDVALPGWRLLRAPATPALCLGLVAMWLEIRVMLIVNQRIFRTRHLLIAYRLNQKTS